MAEEKVFEDPLSDIDPVMEQAFSDSDGFNDPFREESSDLGVEASAKPESVEPEDGFVEFPDETLDDGVVMATDSSEDSLEEGVEDTAVSEVQFPSLTPEQSGKKVEVDVFSNIPVNLSVELGRSQISLKEVFELTEGSIIELERLVGEPLDLVVNGQVIAQGEVVAIDNNYGLRITNIVAQLKK